VRITEQLHKIKGQFIMSINDVLEIREIFAGFEMVEAVKAGTTKGRRELVISNAG